MDPKTNLEEQRKLASEIIQRSDALVPDDMCIARMGAQLAELVVALDEWRLKGGFSPYAPTGSPGSGQA